MPPNDSEADDKSEPASSHCTRHPPRRRVKGSVEAACFSAHIIVCCYCVGLKRVSGSASSKDCGLRTPSNYLDGQLTQHRDSEYCLDEMCLGRIRNEARGYSYSRLIYEPPWARPVLLVIWRRSRPA